MRASLLLGCSLLLSFACAPGPSDPKADESRSRQELIARAEKSGDDALRVTVDAYARAIAELERFQAETKEKFKDLSPSEILGTTGAELKGSIDAAQKQINVLRERMQIYSKELGRRGAALPD